MLPKKNRLTRREINLIKSTTTPAYLPIGLLYKTQGSGKIAVIVSKKIHKHAVVRNRIRRQIYSLLQTVDMSNQNLIFYPNHNSTKHPPSALAQKISAFVLNK